MHVRAKLQELQDFARWRASNSAPWDVPFEVNGSVLLSTTVKARSTAILMLGVTREDFHKEVPSRICIERSQHSPNLVAKSWQCHVLDKRNSVHARHNQVLACSHVKRIELVGDAKLRREHSACSDRRH